MIAQLERTLSTAIQNNDQTPPQTIVLTMVATMNNTLQKHRIIALEWTSALANDPTTNHSLSFVWCSALEVLTLVTLPYR